MKAETVAIIGAGPAGLACAIQLRRYGIQALVFERGKVGGLLNNANLVENYPGFPGGIPGPQLVERMRSQSDAIGVRFRFEEVKRLDLEGDRFGLDTTEGRYEAEVAVVASGTIPNHFQDVELSAQVSERVLYEVVPLLEVSGRKIAVVGAGDAAFDYALNLARRNQVVILNRSQQVHCLPLLWERAKAHPWIRYIEHTRVWRARPGVDARLCLDCAGLQGDFELRADYLVGALGRRTCLDFMSHSLIEMADELESQGRLYRIGDVQRGIYRQTSIAVGDGVLAAMQIYRYLEVQL